MCINIHFIYMDTHYIWYLYIIYIRHRWYDKNARKLTGECVCDGINEWRIWAIEWIILLASWWVEFGKENRKIRRMRKKLYLVTGTRRYGGGQMGVTVWRGVKVKGIKTTLCCKSAVKPGFMLRSPWKVSRKQSDWASGVQSWLRMWETKHKKRRDKRKRRQ